MIKQTECFTQLLDCTQDLELSNDIDQMTEAEFFLTEPDVISSKQYYSRSRVSELYFIAAAFSGIPSNHET